MSTGSFKELTRRQAQESLHRYLETILESAKEEERDSARLDFNGFENLFKRYLEEKGQSSIEWNKIRVVHEELVRPYKLLSEVSDVQPSVIQDQLNKLVVIKLNGGLGTSMGCVGPKSVITVREDLTFLDMTVQQIEDLNRKYGVNVPLVLMNSFNTHADTEKVLKKYVHVHIELHTFNQSRFPRIERESMLPVTNRLYGDHDAWYPPGHGDIYQSLFNSGLLQKFIDQGKQYMFVSNVDNLGATVDLKILNFLFSPPTSLTDDEHHEFLMEVTDKTTADIKGGTLIEYDGKLRLLEAAQVPGDHIDEFKSVRKFRIFNTNNFWAYLPAVKRIIEDQGMQMEIIINPKTLNNGQNVIQLETACGAAIKCFNGSVGVNVPRRRFLPVKTTSDLLIVMSDLYDVVNGSLAMSPKRAFPSTPLVKLGSQFSKVREFLNRFASVPDMLELDHLTVSGDVTFGKNISLKGTVIIIANHGNRIDIPSGSLLENKVVSGNLRILDH